MCTVMKPLRFTTRPATKTPRLFIIPIIIGAPIIIIDIIIVIHSYIVNRHCCKAVRVAAVIGRSKLLLATRLDKISRKWDTPSLLITCGASLGI